MTDKNYIKLVGEELGWERVPPGSRLSTYQIPQYQEVSKAYAQLTLDSIERATPLKPTVQPVPYTGVQFLAIPEFQDLGTRVSQQISAAIAGPEVGQATRWRSRRSTPRWSAEAIRRSHDNHRPRLGGPSRNRHRTCRAGSEGP